MTERQRQNSFTPRDKRKSNGPGASPADKYPEDSPTRVRPLPRFPFAANNHRARSSTLFPEQQELNLGDVEAFPTLGEAVNQPKRASRITSTATAMAGYPTDPSVLEAEQAALCLEQRDIVGDLAEQYGQHSIERGAQTRPPPGLSLPSNGQLTPAQQHTSAQLQPTAYSEYQQRLSQQGFNLPGFPRLDQPQTREMEQEMTQQPRPQFAQESLADLVAAQEQQQQQSKNTESQDSPLRGCGPATNHTYGFDRLTASQQALRQATVAQLHAALRDPQSW